VGAFVGAMVGEELLIFVGLRVGCPDGCLVGCPEGMLVGNFEIVGDTVGMAVGENDPLIVVFLNCIFVLLSASITIVSCSRGVRHFIFLLI
jgi:hypothetical protein